jgi:hypothetical protein
MSVMLVAATAFCSLAVDYARVQCAKTELRRTADAAARAAAVGLLTSTTQARSSAIAAAALNTVDGTSYTMSSSDIDVGNWSNGTFTNNGTPLNAVRVHVYRTQARGTAIPLIFARTIGMNSADVTATTVSQGTAGQPGGFIGLNGITVKNNVFVASYNSGSTANPSQSNYDSLGDLASNGVISGNNNNDLYGALMEGPSASDSGINVHGTTDALVSNIPTPTSPAWSPAGNPGGIPQSYTVSSNTTLPGGTYYFTALTVNANLTFSGPATVYVNGDIAIGATLEPSSLVPSDLTIYQLGSNRNFGDGSSNGMDVVAVVSAPGADFLAKNNMKFRGSLTCNTITCKNNAEFYYDESNGSATGAPTISVSQ